MILQTDHTMSLSTYKKAAWGPKYGVFKILHSAYMTTSVFNKRNYRPTRGSNIFYTEMKLC